ncbi:MAG: hypothetical protein QOH60_114 [Mycobacterium sp.]|nr:hypothetical protein [Mycobacterium sp.]
MTSPSRAGISRRGSRRPGWLLLTVLLVLAIAASSALVFTERVELLKLAVILSLWAAAVGAFVSVIYRRQSDIDQARSRDLKLVYDLQLDREISARREYELEVETQLRRELSNELRSQAADEVAALRAELAALRTNLEIMFDTDLSQRPAIEPERTTVRAYSDWQRDTDPGRRRGAAFVASAPPDNGEDAIIDVPEEPAVPVESVRVVEPEPPIFEPAPPPMPPPMWTPPPSPAAPVQAPAQSGGRHGVGSGANEWQPAAAEAQWVTPLSDSREEQMAPMSDSREEQPVPPTPGGSFPPPAPPVDLPRMNGSAGPPQAPPPSTAPDEPRRGRHYNVPDPVGAPAGPPSSRHASEQNAFAPAPPEPPTPAAPPTPSPAADAAARHGASDTNGQSVAELLARLQPSAGSAAGGRRRRRDG